MILVPLPLPSIFVQALLGVNNLFLFFLFFFVFLFFYNTDTDTAVGLRG